MARPTIRGPINVSRSKADLQKIAKALSIYFQPTNTVKWLVENIKKYITENSDRLSQDPDFQQLIVYGAGNAGRGKVRGVLTKQTGKNSADKAAKDKREIGKNTKPVTG